MSGHNPPHGRLGQPNTSWNPLQVPSYVPRQPQLAHMSSERPMARSPVTWHTPPTHQDKMYRCTTGNLMNNLEINPLLQGYGRNVGMPLGTVDLSLSSAARSTPSPKGAHTNVQPQSCSTSSSALPSNIPTSAIYNMAGDSGQLGTNHQTRTSTTTAGVPPSGGVIQSTNTAAALKERMQQGASYMSLGSGNAANCFGGTHSIGDSTTTAGAGGISGGNGFGADLSSRAANDLTTLVTGGLLIKDAKQINSEMDTKNGRDCFPHLPTADSADLVKEFIMQTMQNSNALSVSPKRTSPLRSAMQNNLSPTRSRSPPLNLLLGASVMGGKLVASEVLNSTSLTVPIVGTPASLLLTGESKAAASATESTDSGNSSGAGLGMGGSHLSGCSGAAGGTSLPSSNPAASPTNNSITSSEDSVDSLNGRSNSRRRRKPERTSKMNAPEGGGSSSSFFPLGKGIDGAAVLEELGPLRSTNAVRGDISALAIEGINALSHGLTGNNNGPLAHSIRGNSVHHHGGPALHENHTPAAIPTVQQHLHDNLIQSNINSSTTKSGPSIQTRSLVGLGGGGTGSTDTNTNDAPPKDASISASSTVSARGVSMPTACNALHKESTAKDPSDCETIDKIAAMVSADTVVTKSFAHKREESFVGNGTAIDLAVPERNCNGPTRQNNTAQEEKNVHTPGDKLNASDSSYEEVENKLEEMFAGIEEQTGKLTDPATSGVQPRANSRNNGCHDHATVNQLPSKNRSLPAAVSDGDVLKQLSSDAVADEEMKDVSLASGTDAGVGGGAASRKKPLTPAQKRGNGTKGLPGHEAMATSTPAAKRKRGPKKKSTAHGKPCPFPSPETPSMVSLKALATKKKDKKGGKSKSGSGKKGKVGVKGAKTANNNNERAASSSSVWPANAPSIETGGGKYKGPYVQVKSDGSHTVINTPINEDDGDKAQNKTKKFGNSLNSSERSKIRGLHVSTLSTKYDADTTDTSWMCVFCKTGPHKFRLGDLFGPYIISTTSSEFQQSQVDLDFFSVKRSRESLESQQAKEKREQQQKQLLQELGGPKSKKRKNAAGGTTTTTTTALPSVSGPTGSKAATALIEEMVADDQKQLAMTDIFYGMVKAGDSTYEVWTHEDCLLWAPGVYMVGTRIVGLEAAIWNCCRHQCELCTHYGAVVSCLRQGCSAKAHFICAHKQNWKMSHDFQSFCEMHARAEESASLHVDAASTPTQNHMLHPAKQPKKEFKVDKDMVNPSSSVS